MTDNLTVSRRNMLKLFGLGAASAGLLSLAPTMTASAQSSPSDADVVAYFRFKLGDYDLTVISDNAFMFPPANFNVQGEASEADDFFAARNLVGDDGNVTVAVNNLLMQTGEQTVLFDTGTGNRTVATLDALGIGADGIDAVVVSHIHGDHIGALSVDGNLTFPNASIHLAEPERAFMEDGPEQAVSAANDIFAPAFAEDGRVVMYNDGDEIVTGVQAIATHGHTPGHMAFLIESNGSQLIHFNDSVVSPFVSTANPDWVFGFDFNPEDAVASRRMILDRAVESGAQVMGYHFPFPGLGYIIADGDNYAYIPAAF